MSFQLVVSALLLSGFSLAQAAIPTCVGNRDPYLYDPVGAPWRSQTLFHATPPANYTTPHLVAWVNVATLHECIPSGEAKSTVEIRRLEIWERKSSGAQIIVKQFPVDPYRRDFVSGLFQRRNADNEADWFGGESSGRVDFPMQSASVTETWASSILSINIAKASTGNGVYHAWTEPRVAVSPTSRVYFKAYIRTLGTARIQLGGDWYSSMWGTPVWSSNCSSSQCELGASDWINTWGFWQWVTFPK